MNPYPSSLLYNTLEGGTNGTVVSTANSGGASGNAFNSTQRTATAVLQYSSTSPLKDTMSLRVLGDGSGYANVRWTSASVGTLTVSCGAMHAKFDNFTTLNTILLAMSDDGDTAIVYRLKTTTTGALRLSNGANTATIADTSATMTAGQTYRIEWQINHSSGAYTIEFFNPDESTPLGQATGVAAGLGAQTQQIRLGVVSLSTWGAYFDNIAIGSSKLGPTTPPPATATNPYANATAFNIAEGGANNVAVTTGNSGGLSGTAFTTIQASGTATVKFTNNAIHDALSYAFNGDGSGYANLRWNSSILGTLATSCGAVYVKFDDLAATKTFFLALSDDGETVAYRLKLTSAGALQLASGASATIATTTGVMDTSHTYRIEWQINHTTRAYTIEFFEGDSTSALGSASGTAAVGELGTQTQQVRLGIVTQSAWTATFDSFAMYSSKVGTRVNSALPPVVNAGAGVNSYSYQPVTLTATASDSNGDTVTVTWTQTAGTPTVQLVGSGFSTSFVAPATRNGTVLTFTASASDGTLTATDQVAVTIYPHSEWAVMAGVEQPIHSYDI